MKISFTWHSADLCRLWPHGSKTLLDGINAAKDTILPKYGICSMFDLVQFMATISEETGGGVRLEEDLCYSGARLWAVFGHSHFHDLHDAAAVAAGGPRVIADRIYGGRNGNTMGSHDGYAFRGRGLMQLTGRGVFEMVAKRTGLDLVRQPELAADPANALECAAAYWEAAGVNALGDAGDTLAVCRRVNGGLVNLATRQAEVAIWSRVAFYPIPPSPAAQAAQASLTLSVAGFLGEARATPALVAESAPLAPAASPIAPPDVIPAPLMTEEEAIAILEDLPTGGGVSLGDDLELFQRDRGLEETGVIDIATSNALRIEKLRRTVA